MAVLWNTTTGTMLAARVDRLSGFRKRLVGLLARPRLRPDEGVWLASCHAIHTVGMRYAIDVVFVDRAGEVMRVCRNVGPNRLALSCAKADAVVELGGGALDDAAVTVGDRLALVATFTPDAPPHDREPR